MMKQQRFSKQCGVTLIELSWGMALGVIVAAGLFSAQRTSVDSFNGTIEEHRSTGTLRTAMQGIRTQLRSARPNTIEVGGVSALLSSGETPILTFQEPISFDYSTGEVTWGADTVADASVGYYVEEDELVKYVVVDGVRNAETRAVLVDDLANRPSQPSVYFTWIESKNLMALTLFVEAPGGFSQTPREVNTMIRVEPVFDF